MKPYLYSTFAFALLGLSCSDTPASTKLELRINTPCMTATDCPVGFECERDRAPDGGTTSFCESREDHDGAATECPKGFATEEDHEAEAAENHEHEVHDCVPESRDAGVCPPGEHDKDGHCEADDESGEHHDAGPEMHH